MDALVHLKEENGGGGAGGTGGSIRREASSSDIALGVLNADDAGVVSQLHEQPTKRMGVFVVVCVAFGLIVSEAKTEAMFSHTKGTPEVTAVFSVEAAGKVYNKTNEFDDLGRNVIHNKR